MNTWHTAAFVALIVIAVATGAFVLYDALADRYMPKDNSDAE